MKIKNEDITVNGIFFLLGFLLAFFIMKAFIENRLDMLEKRSNESYEMLLNYIKTPPQWTHEAKQK